MAYQTRGRDPLLDSTMQAAIEKRGKELAGLALIGVGVLTLLMLLSYHPDDPNWMLASDAPVQNWLGRTGASLAHPLMMIVGLGTWIIPLVLMVWGIRLSAHWGEERAFGRLILAPVAVFGSAVFAATILPGPSWDQSFGLGGMLGDTVLGIALTLVPISGEAGVRVATVLLSIGLGLTMLGLLAFVLGFTRHELRLGGRFVLFGLVMSYDIVLRVLGRAAVACIAAARGAQERIGAVAANRRARMHERRAAAGDNLPHDPPRPEGRGAAVLRATPRMPRDAAAGFDHPAGNPPVTRPAAPVSPRRMPPLAAGRDASAPVAPLRDVAPVAPLRDVAPVAPRRQPVAGPLTAPVTAPVTGRMPEAEPVRTGGLLSRMPAFFGRSEPARMPEPELVPPAFADLDVDMPDDDRIKARISHAIRARQQATAPEPRVEPVVTRPRKPVPLILNTAPRMPLPPEPPVTADAARRLPVPPPPAADDLLDDEDAGWPSDAPHRAPLVADPLFDPDAPSRPGAQSVTPAGAPSVVPSVTPPGALPVAEPRRVNVHHSPRKPVQPSARARAEAQPALPLEDRYADYEYPPLNLLTSPDEVERHHLSDEALEENARMLENVLDDYGVKGEIVSVRPGPVVTMYELEPAPGLKASRVIGLADDIARSMSALSARVSTVPGRSVIGIELPNEKREMVVLREMLAARDFGDSQMRLPLALGKDIGGEPVIANLAKMPHLLIAGTTGSGKSVAINTMILSLLYKLTPAECRLIMIDPKMLELSVYDGIPHLLSPVVTDPKKAVVALKWVVAEMEDRYRKMSKMGVRNIEGYNGRVRDALSRSEMFERTVQTGFDEETGDPIFETEEFAPEAMPYIVVIVDEMADLMMVAGKEIEACIQRLAQMARASGIHLIMATQRPSVDVITGTIKANFPTRISFQVTSKIDSRTILGEMGAEQLLGMGDMLYMAGGGRISRIHGPFCSDEEVEEIVNYLKGFGPPDYMSGVVDGPDEDTESSIDQVLGLSGSGGGEGDEALYDMAVQIVAKDRKCSTSYIQRKLAIGYNKAARLVEQMEDQGVVSAANHVGKREVLVPEVH